MLRDAVSVADYIERAGLTLSGATVASFAEKVQQLQTELQAYLATTAASNAAPEVQWQYKVPELGEGGACSLFGHLADEPYDLTAILGGKNAENQRLLAQLSNIAAFYREHSGLDWFGIYQARANINAEPVLVKLAYYGAASRAEFPLNSEFAKISNNSTVGLSGKAKVINDVAAYLGTGGEYYTCDPKVQAEACLPLFDQSGKIVGIVDAEDFNKNVFTADALALLVAVCLTIPAYLP
ncbi:GAF domain-containing protein [Rheinheimera maricola]|uniref:Histidine kinase n=1 Tax=Rheinheimera maricola TaxID=2793282 RepID=A0ABS7XA63_9GAMM|nr:GAF domain-containing protein [Rheinheimera maricola]MBZ9612074.1 histidine kinase [Rheinheimera maricola]